MTPISVIVLTLNEAQNIGKCLLCLEWADDIIIVDSFSSDSTLAICRATMPRCRVFQNAFLDFGQQRNWALDNTYPAHDWVLFVDADEFVGPRLVQEIDIFLGNPGVTVGAYIAGKNYFLGKWLRYSTLYPSYQLRLLKLGKVQFRKEGHGQVEVSDGPFVYFKGNWRHEGFSKGLNDWIAKHNSYSDNELELILTARREPMKPLSCLHSDPIIRRRALKRLSARIPGRAWWRFLYAYIFRLGALDGYAGFVVCQLYLAHDLHISAKLAEYQYRQRIEETANRLDPRLQNASQPGGGAVAINKASIVRATKKQGKSLSEIEFHDSLANLWEAKYERRAFKRRSTNLLQLLNGARLERTRWLDAGCGTGHLTRELARRDCAVIGIDAAPAMIAVARNLATGSNLGSNSPQFDVISTVERLPMADATFDGVLCSSVLEYVKQPEICLTEFYRVLKPGGLLLISVPNRASVLRRSLVVAWKCAKLLRYQSPLAYMLYSVNEYTFASFADHLSTRGFAVIGHSFAGTHLPVWADSSPYIGTLINVLARRVE